MVTKVPDKTQTETGPFSSSEESIRLSVDQPSSDPWLLSPSVINADTIDYSSASEAMNTETSNQDPDSVKMDTDSELSTYVDKDAKILTEVITSGTVKDPVNELSERALQRQEGHAFEEHLVLPATGTVIHKVLDLEAADTSTKAETSSEKASVPNKIYCKTRNFSSIKEKDRYISIVDRCLKAFSFCLKRFPEHYKSQYKTVYVRTYYPTHKDLSWSRDLLLGNTSPPNRSIPLPVHGLFTDKSKTNLFQVGLSSFLFILSMTDKSVIILKTLWLVYQLHNVR